MKARLSSRHDLRNHSCSEHKLCTLVFNAECHGFVQINKPQNEQYWSLTEHTDLRRVNTSRLAADKIVQKNLKYDWQEGEKKKKGFSEKRKQAPSRSVTSRTVSGRIREATHTHLWYERGVNLLDDVVHLREFGSYQRAVGSADVPDVIQTQIMQDQNIPVVPLQSAVQMTGHVIVHLTGQEAEIKIWEL